METIKITRRISSPTLKIKELEKFLNKKVKIVIYPIPDDKNKKKNLKELLDFSQWDIDEEDVRINSWKLPKY